MRATSCFLVMATVFGCAVANRAGDGGTIAVGSGNGGSAAGGGGPSGGAPGNVGSGNGGGGRGGAQTFVSLAVPPGAPLERSQGTSVSPAPPPGWLWYEIAGAICRDKSATGFYVRYTSSDRLLIYLEGGGACISPGFCSYNPANVNQILSGDVQTAFGSVGGATAGRQQPGCYSGGTPTGIFDTANAANPFKDWNMIYVPYCTGDVFFGTRTDVMVPGVSAPQQFVGYRDMQKFVARWVPTFKDTVKRVILTGSSAGGFGAALNFSMVQDSFGGGVAVDVLDDSGPPFADTFMPVCMQKKWRDLWGLNDALPPDCAECLQTDGGGLVHLSDFLVRKHPAAKIALVSSMQDEIIRLFYSAGNNDCMGFDQADPVGNFLFTLGGTFPADQYTAGLDDLRTTYVPTGRFGTYFLGGSNITFHQHIWRARFFDAAAGTVPIAQWVTDFLGGKVAQVGP